MEMVILSQYTSEDESLRKLVNDNLLRREAGEGWHADGLNQDVFGAIIAREVALDDALKNGDHFSNDLSAFGDRFISVRTKVTELKEVHGIGDPPPLVSDLPIHPKKV